MKIDVFDYPTVVWRNLSREPLRISAKTLCRQKLDSTAYIFAADSMGPSSFIFLRWAPRDASMRFGRSRSSKVVDFGTNRKGVCDFLLVINSNFGPILHCFWDTASYWLKIANFSYPTLVWRPRSGGTRQNFWMKLTAQKLEGWGYCMVKIAWYLTSAVFAWITRVTDRRTDRQTDGIAIAYARLQHIMLSRAKTKIGFSWPWISDQSHTPRRETVFDHRL